MCFPVCGMYVDTVLLSENLTQSCTLSERDFAVLWRYMEEDMSVDAVAGSEGGVERAIGLALLEKDADATAQLSSEVENILAFVSEVQSVEAGEVEQDGGAVNVFRDDVVTVEAEKYREGMLAQAPASFKRWFLSKKIL